VLTWKLRTFSAAKTGRGGKLPHGGRNKTKLASFVVRGFPVVRYCQCGQANELSTLASKKKKKKTEQL
jgi:hypothetical protein